jgi:hypothetical protein
MKFLRSDGGYRESGQNRNEDIKDRIKDSVQKGKSPRGQRRMKIQNERKGKADVKLLAPHVGNVKQNTCVEERGLLLWLLL